MSDLHGVKVGDGVSVEWVSKLGNSAADAMP